VSTSFQAQHHARCSAHHAHSIPGYASGAHELGALQSARRVCLIIWPSAQRPRFLCTSTSSVVPAGRRGQSVSIVPIRLDHAVIIAPLLPRHSVVVPATMRLADCAKVAPPLRILSLVAFICGSVDRMCHRWCMVCRRCKAHKTHLSRVQGQ